MLEYYHNKLNETWGAKTISLKSGGAMDLLAPPGSATYDSCCILVLFGVTATPGTCRLSKYKLLND